MVVPHTTVEFAPMLAPRRTRVCTSASLRGNSQRGVRTLVNTADGPTKTWSSRVTPAYTETLFCTCTPSPITTPGPTSTFCPKTHFLPTFARDCTCVKCQIFVPSPTSAPSSTTADPSAKYAAAAPAPTRP